MKKTSTSQKIIIVAIVVLTIVMISLVVSLSNQTDYAVLYSGPTEQASQIFAALEDMPVDTQIVQTGTTTTIMVPKDQKASINLQLIEDGVITSGMVTPEYGQFYIENASSFGSTDQDKERFYNFQQQVTLTDTINSMPQIKESTVFLAPAVQSPFVLTKTEQQASASVYVTLANGVAQLSDSEAQSIKELVARSVTNLPVENVVLIDNNLHTYGLDTGTGDGSGVAGNQYNLQLQVSQQLSNQILSLLTPVFGTGKVTASVSATLDFDKVTEEVITLEPPTDVGADENMGIITQLAEYQERILNAAGVEGEPGMDPNGGAPIYQALTEEELANSIYYKVSRELSAEVNETKQLIERAQGKITSLSATVLIDGDPNADAALSDLVDTLPNLVSTAIGVDPALVSVAAVPFEQTAQMQQAIAEQNAAIAEVQRSELIKTIIQYGAILGGIVLVIALLLNSRKKKREAELMEQRLKWEQEQAEAQAEQARLNVVADEEISLEDIMAEDEKNSPLGQIQDMIKKNPQGIAQLLRNWLMEDYDRR